MQPIDPFWNLVIQVITAAVAVAALILGIVNARREKRRDEARIHVGLRTGNIKQQDGRIEAMEVEGEITNTGQRPTTLQAAALVFARRRLWRWSWGKGYIWSQSIPMSHVGSMPLQENRPQTIRWRWELIEGTLRKANITEPRFVGVRARLAGERLLDIVPRRRKLVEEAARQVMSGQLPVERRPKK